MQLDLFAELRDLQRHALVEFQRRCDDTDFTDRDSVMGLQTELETVRSLLRDCAALEGTHLYPLVAQLELEGFAPAHDRYLVNQQLLAVHTRLDILCEHVHRNNPVWRSLLTREGLALGRNLHMTVHAALLYLECLHAATMAVSLHRGVGALPAAQRPLAAAVPSLKESYACLLAGDAGQSTRAARPADEITVPRATPAAA